MSIAIAPVAIVVGGATGVGRSCALSLASTGISVVVHVGEGNGDRSGADSVVREIRNSGGRAEPDYSDLTTFSGAEPLVDHTTNVFSGLDILVNDVSGLHHLPIDSDGQGDELDREFAIHVKTVGGMLRAVLAPMAAQGRGRIVNIADAFPSVSPPGFAACLAAQSAVAGLTNCVAAEGAARGIVANLVSGPEPGPVPAEVLGRITEIVIQLATTDRNDVTARGLRIEAGDVVADVAAEARELQPMGEWGTDEIAAAMRAMRPS